MEWWQHNWGNIASVAGLVISVFAWRRAQRASEAAKRALAAQHQRTLAQELRLCSEKVTSVARRCRSNDWLRAGEEADELLQRISIAQNRWKDQLVDNLSKDELNLVVEHLGVVAGQVRRLAFTGSTDEQNATLDRALNLITRKLASEVGKHEHAVEKFSE
ncbi:MAG TPA: hypothetical protein VGQ46_11110 [Thermoanaerobaculia bacterium]|jgi:hypothetical protein|nr:hypothetical protein [Thermoanaerobaculia bacterium]